MWLHRRNAALLQAAPHAVQSVLERLSARLMKIAQVSKKSRVQRLLLVGRAGALAQPLVDLLVQVVKAGQFLEVDGFVIRWHRGCFLPVLPRSARAKS